MKANVPELLGMEVLVRECSNLETVSHCSSRRICFIKSNGETLCANGRHIIMFRSFTNYIFDDIRKNPDIYFAHLQQIMLPKTLFHQFKESLHKLIKRACLEEATKDIVRTLGTYKKDVNPAGAF